jgi:hypothetical protein
MKKSVLDKVGKLSNFFYFFKDKKSEPLATDEINKKTRDEIDEKYLE